jgi:putative transposase
MIIKTDASSFQGSARASRAIAGASPAIPETINYSKRRLPHFERAWGKYAVALSTHERRHLMPGERDLVLQSILYGYDHNQYELYVGCVMPDHVHLLFEPQIKDQDAQGRTTFWSLAEILQGIKSSSAHRINKCRGAKGPVWEKESFDRLIRSEADLHEKFRYICRNPWDAGAVGPTEDYPWLWTQEFSSAGAPKSAREARALPEYPSASRKGDVGSLPANRIGV